MVQEELDKIASMLGNLGDDTSVPKNVRLKIAEAKKRLESNDDFAAKVSIAVYALDEVSNDINMPMHARTLIWNILSELESLKNRELQNE